MGVETHEEVEALCADQKRKGVTILQEPVTMDFGRTFLAADPTDIAFGCSVPRLDVLLRAWQEGRSH
jgi:hypothetical protein